MKNNMAFFILKSYEMWYDNCIIKDVLFLKKNAFTLMELLATIGVLAIILLIAVPLYNRMLGQSQESLYKTQVKLIEEAGLSYFLYTNANSKELEKTLVSIGELYQQRYLASIPTNPNTGDIFELDLLVVYNATLGTATLTEDMKDYYSIPFYFTGDSQTFTADKSGYYDIELWGARGGYYGSLGAYTRGTIYLAQNEKLYFYIGEYSEVLNTSTFNGGDGSNNLFPGGGATDVRLVSGTWTGAASLRSRIMVAGGGGAGITVSGAGGTLVGKNSVNITGGTQTSGGVGNGGLDGVLGKGGSNCGGGGGYWGGGGNTTCNEYGGAGGSSYISGHVGTVALNSASNNDPKSGCTIGSTKIECSYHYSGKVFSNTKMVAGDSPLLPSSGRTEGHGFATITYNQASSRIVFPGDIVIYVNQNFDNKKDVIVYDLVGNSIPLSNLEVSGAPNIKKAGRYQISYTLKHGGITIATKTRNVIVKDHNAKIEFVDNIDHIATNPFDPLRGVRLYNAAGTEIPASGLRVSTNGNKIFASDLRNVRYIKNCVNGNTINGSNHWVELQAFVGGTNVALNKSVTGTSAIHPSSPAPYSSITNGATATNPYANANSGGNQCITVDLSTSYNLDSIKLWHYYGDGRTYNDNVTMVSNDNVNWRIVGTGSFVETSAGQLITNSVSGSSKVVDVNKMGTQVINYIYEEDGVIMATKKRTINVVRNAKKLDNVRYIRNCINGSTTNVDNHWVELQAFVGGTNVALNKSVTGTSAIHPGSLAPYSSITNGATATSPYAMSADPGKQCITVDLGTMQDLSQIKLWHYHGNGRTYSDNVTMVSHDNINWRIVGTGPIVETSAGQTITNVNNYNRLLNFSTAGVTLKFDFPRGYELNLGPGSSMTVEFEMYVPNNISSSVVTPFSYMNGSFYCSSGTCGISSNNETDKLGMTGGFPFPAGNTYHVAVVFFSGINNATNSEIYINGVKQSISQITGSPKTQTLTNFVAIGGGVNSSGTASTNRLDGTIKNFRIWRVKRTGTEINSNKGLIITSHPDLIWSSDY